MSDVREQMSEDADLIYYPRLTSEVYEIENFVKKNGKGQKPGK